MYFRYLSFFKYPATLTPVAFPRSIFSEQGRILCLACLPNGRIDHGVVKR
jgi:hypothetical protein